MIYGEFTIKYTTQKSVAHGFISVAHWWHTLLPADRWDGRVSSWAEEVTTRWERDPAEKQIIQQLATDIAQIPIHSIWESFVCFF